MNSLFSNSRIRDLRTVLNCTISVNMDDILSHGCVTFPGVNLGILAMDEETLKEEYYVEIKKIAKEVGRKYDLNPLIVDNELVGWYYAPGV